MKVGFIQPTAICRHSKGDPNCSSSHSYSAPSYTTSVTTPDSEKFEIEEILEQGKHLVVKVRYPNCSKCSFEGNKVMVFLNCTLKDAIKWRKIDPHFRTVAMNPVDKKVAPSPAARFPGSQEGWTDALMYARHKQI